MAKKTMEQYVKKLAIVEETLLCHFGSFTKNSCDARVIATVELPDGRTMHCNKVIRLRFKEEKN